LNFSKKKRQRSQPKDDEFKLYENRRKPKNSISKNLTETQDRTIEREDIVAPPKPKRRSNLLMRAAELMKDPLLDFDRDKNKKTVEEEEEQTEINLSALENPKSFMKAHFPIVYPYTRKVKHVQAGSQPFAAKIRQNFLVPSENIEMGHSTVCKKIWSPTIEAEIDCKLYLVIIYF
jgi:hypothetical protein